jgi:hypothetical protein
MEEIIRDAIVNFEAEFDKQPYGILVHPSDCYRLLQHAMDHGGIDSKGKFWGLNIYRSSDVEKGDFKLVI